ncbi:MAG: hypothetical protein GY792_07145 [Gammaproteobacteria bacterium]|nr:hypothetical protein [Gammaproteobacteria bacterium]
MPPRFGVLNRPLPGETANGGGYFIRHFSGKTLVAVIDGVGHGPKAEEAAQGAMVFLADHYH